MYDSWGASWFGAWGTSWVHPTPVIIVGDTHDGGPERIREYKRRREELHEQILRAFEEVTGESRIPSVAEIAKEEKARPIELNALRRVREDVLELNELNESIVRLSKVLQEREMDDIAFIMSVL